MSKANHTAWLESSCAGHFDSKVFANCNTMLMLHVSLTGSNILLFNGSINYATIWHSFFNLNWVKLHISWVVQVSSALNPAELGASPHPVQAGHWLWVSHSLPVSHTTVVIISPHGMPVFLSSPVRLMSRLLSMGQLLERVAIHKFPHAGHKRTNTYIYPAGVYFQAATTDKTRPFTQGAIANCHYMSLYMYIHPHVQLEDIWYHDCLL